MPRFDPTEFGRFIAHLTPHELRQAEGMLAEARKRAEAVMEIDARAEVGGPAASCPRCECDERVRWGRTRTGAQRWRCSGRSDTPIARGHRPDLMAALVRDMMAVPQPALVPPRGPGLGALA